MTRLRKLLMSWTWLTHYNGPTHYQQIVVDDWPAQAPEERGLMHEGTRLSDRMAAMNADLVRGCGLHSSTREASGM